MNYYSKENGLFCRLNSAISFIYGTIFPSSMQKSPNFLPLFLSSPGLKALIDSHSSSSSSSSSLSSSSSNIIHSYMISSKPLTRTTSSSLSSSLSFDHFSSSSVSDDMLGTESGVYLGSSSFTDKRVDIPSPTCRRYQRRTEKKTYPPPIPLLARRGNLPGYRPWSLTRRYVDGRLILTEERVKHDEYLEAIRENGRLILNLVTFRDPEEDEEEEQEEEAEMEIEELELTQEEEEEEEEEEKKEEEEEEEIEEAFSGHCSIPKKPSLEYEMERISGGQKCNLTYGFMSPSSSSPIPPMATVV